MIRPPYDPELAAALIAYKRSGLPGTIRSDDIAELRAFTASYAAADDEFPGIEMADLAAPGDPDVTVTILRPRDVDQTARLAGMLYIHGGGMVAGTSRVALDVVAEWIRAVPMVVVSVDYRLAPEHPHPAPVDDCYAALSWMTSNAADLGIDADRIVVAGGSAGGGLAAAVSLMARDRDGPRLVGQLLMCPMLDDRTVSLPGRPVDKDDDGPWNLVSNTTGWTSLLGPAAGSEGVSPYAAPSRATDLSGLPPTFIDAGSAELFRDEDVAFCSRIWMAGGRAELHIWPGGFHGFDVVGGTSSLAIDAKEARVNWLRRVLEN